MTKTATPIFRVEGKNTTNASVIIQCSECEKDIRPMMPSEEIAVDRGIYCSDCEDGAVYLNMPVTKGKKDE